MSELTAKLSESELSAAQAKGELTCASPASGKSRSVSETLAVVESAGVVVSSELNVHGLVLLGLGRHVLAPVDGAGILKALLLSKMFHAFIAQAYVSARAAVYSSPDKPTAICKGFPVSSS